MDVAKLNSRMYDVVVVGGGIMGSSSAYECAKRGHSVLLLEQFDFLHRRGSSHGESRIIRRTYPEDWYTEMMPKAYALWEEASKDAGYSPLTTTGSLDFGPEDNRDLKELMAACQRHSVPHEVLEYDALRLRYPGLEFPVGTRGVFSREGGVLHATKACAMFQQLAVKYGASLVDRVSVSGIREVLRMDKAATNSSMDRSNTSVSSSHSLNEERQEHDEGKDRMNELRQEHDKGPGFVLSTSRGEFRCKSCVLACGAWTAQLAETISDAGLPFLIQPLHVHVAYWQVNPKWEDMFSAHNGCPVFVNYDDVDHVYSTPILEYPGLMKISSHNGKPCNPNHRPPSNPELSSKAPSQWIRKFLGEKVGLQAAMVEPCMYSMTPDQDFILDILPLRHSTTTTSTTNTTNITGTTATTTAASSLNSQEAASEAVSVTKREDGRRLGRVVVAAGFSGHGFKFGPLIGSVMADLVETGTSSQVPLERFSLGRFANGCPGNVRESGPQVKTSDDCL